MEYILFGICVYACVVYDIMACTCVPGEVPDHRRNVFCSSDYVIKGEVIASERRPQHETNLNPSGDLYILTVGIETEYDIFKTPDSLNPFRSESGSQYFSLLNLTTLNKEGLCGMTDYFEMNVPYYLSGECDEVECTIYHCDWYMECGVTNTTIEYQQRTYLKMWAETCGKCVVEQRCDLDCPGEKCPLFYHQEQLCVQKCIDTFYIPQPSLENCAIGLNITKDELITVTVDSDDFTSPTRSLDTIFMETTDRISSTAKVTASSNSTIKRARGMMYILTQVVIGIIVAGVVQ